MLQRSVAASTAAKFLVCVYCLAKVPMGAIAWIALRDFTKSRPTLPELNSEGGFRAIARKNK
jgi:hypothetical protein